MEFKNEPNKCYDIDGQKIWVSRSMAVAGVVFAWRESDEYPHVLISKRGEKSADFKGLMNLVCGYLDYNESATDAIIRETWEEVGLNLKEIMESDLDIINNMDQPWFVASEPTQNRQNVTMRFGLCFSVDDDEVLPKLTTEYNEVVGEVESPQWIPFKDVDNYEWAFGHDQVIKDYLEFILSK